MTEAIAVHVTVAGRARGSALVLEEPLSLWGGFDSDTGRVTDEHHPQFGERLSGRVVVMPSSRGSSSASTVLAEAVRSGTAPSAFVLGEPDEIIALGCIVAEELYGIVTPVVVAPGLSVDDGADLVVDGGSLQIGS